MPGYVAGGGSGGGAPLATSAPPGVDAASAQGASSHAAREDHTHAGVASLSGLTGAVTMAEGNGIGLDVEEGAISYRLHFDNERGGNLVVHNGAFWAPLYPGDAGQVLTANGIDELPSWETPSVPSPATASPTSVGTSASSVGTSATYARADHAHPFYFGTQSQGDVLYFNGTAWTLLHAGTAGQSLTSGGAGANPSWTTIAPPAAGSATPSNVASAGAVGTAAAYAREDHSHKGVFSIGAFRNAGTLVEATDTAASGSITIGGATFYDAGSDYRYGESIVVRGSGSQVTLAVGVSGQTKGDFLVCEAASAGAGGPGTYWKRLAPGAAGTTLISNGPGLAPSWGTLDNPDAATSTPPAIASAGSKGTTTTYYALADHTHAGVATVNGHAGAINLASFAGASGNKPLSLDTSVSGSTTTFAYGLPNTSGSALGDVYTYGASGWGRMGAGTAGKILYSNGPGAELTWESPTVIGVYPAYSSTPAAVGGTGATAGVATNYARGDHAHALGFSGQTQGDVLYFNGTAWARLPAASAAGMVLASGGAGANPSWATLDDPNPATNTPPAIAATGAKGLATTTYALSDHTHAGVSSVAGFTGAVTIQNGFVNTSEVSVGVDTATSGTVKLRLTSNTQAAGDLMYYVASPTAMWRRLAIGTTNQVLTVAGGVPTWSTPAAAPSAATASPSTVGTTLPIVGTSAAYAREDHAHQFYFGTQTQGDVLYFNGSAWTLLHAGTSGQALLTGGAGANPSWGTPTASLAAGTNGQIYAANGGTNGFTSNPNLGGSINLTAAGGFTCATTSGVTGLSITITAGQNTSGTQAGGALNLNGGNSTAGAGGAINLTAGASGGTTSSGAGLNLTAGSGGSTSGVGGGVSINAGASNGSSAGGVVNISAGNSGGSGTAGAVNLYGGSATGTGAGGAATVNGGNSNGGTPGSLTLTAGTQNGSGAGGSVSISATNSTGGTSAAGSITLTAGSASTSSSAGGGISMTAGNATSAAGGSVSITAGSNLSPSTSSGSITLTTGTNSSTSSTAPVGNINLVGTVGGGGSMGACAISSFYTLSASVNTAWFFSSGGITSATTLNGVMHIGKVTTAPSASPTGTNPGVFLWVDASQNLTCRQSTSTLLYMASAFGSAQASLYVAATSGGSPTTAIVPHNLTIAGTTLSVLCTS